jgi:SAM-dependent methyltransferase
VVSLDADLIAYYDAEARAQRRDSQAQIRIDLRARFAETIRDDGPLRVIDVGAGPGLDSVQWERDGFEIVGLDLVLANVRLLRGRGLTGVTGSLYDLPFRSGSFGALWTMSTFVHVPRARFEDAISEMLRVVVPGAPLGIGTWGGVDYEGVLEIGDLRPYRFFSLTSHERWQEMLGRHGRVEYFSTSKPNEHGWEYQFAVLRAPG